MNKSVKLRPGTTEWNQTCYRDYNGEFLEKDCSSAEITTCLGALSYCRLKRAPLSSSPCISSPELPLENRFGEDRHKRCKVL